MAANQEQYFVCVNEQERSLRGNPASWKFVKSGKIEKFFYVVNPRITIDRLMFPHFLQISKEAGLPRSDLSRSLPQTKYCSWFAAIGCKIRNKVYNEL